MTGKNIDLGKIKLPVDAYASQGNAILGIRDSGKSYTATAIAERLMSAGIPIIAFDPIGIWRYLRVPGAGAGFQIVVAGGKGADLPLTAAGAQEIVRAAMRQNVSLVIDLYDIHLSKADWRRIVASCIRTLLYENGDHGLRHIFIEEAAEFCPQIVGPQQGDVYAEVEKLARMGGNAQLGYTLINQRAEQINKAVLELCDCLILHRQKGRNSLNALSKWLDIATSAGGRELIQTLPGLAQGECWVWPAGIDVPVRTVIPAKASFHPDRRARQGTAKAAAGVDVTGFVASMKGTLEALVKEAEANDPKVLRKTIADLQAQIKTAGAAGAAQAGKADLETLAAAYDDGRVNGYQAGRIAGFAEAEKDILGELAGIDDEVAGIAHRLSVLRAGIAAHEPPPPGAAPAPGQPPAALQRLQRQGSAAPQPVQRRPAPAARTEGMSAAQQRILDELLALDSLGIPQPGKTQLALWCEVSPTSGGYFNNLGALRSAGLIEYPVGGEVCLTDAGRRAAQAREPLTVDEMQQALCARIGNAKAAILRALIQVYPRDLTKDDLAKRIEVSPTSGGYFNNLGSLRSLGVIEYPAPGHVVALPVLFLEGA